MEDERGWFARIFDEGEFAQRGLATRFAQGSIAFNERAGHAARHALPGGAARRGEARPLHPRRAATT